MENNTITFYSPSFIPPLPIYRNLLDRVIITTLFDVLEEAGGGILIASKEIINAKGTVLIYTGFQSSFDDGDFKVSIVKRKIEIESQTKKAH